MGYTIGNKFALTESGKFWFIINNYKLKPEYAILKKIIPFQEEEGNKAILDHIFDVYDDKDKMIFKNWYLEEEEFIPYPLKPKEPEEWL